MGDGDTDESSKPKRIVFVTVGTTSFDSLVRAVDTLEVKEELSKRGYTHLLIQMGRGSYFPNKSNREDGSLAVDYFSFSSSIADSLRSASLVISHAGSIADRPLGTRPLAMNSVANTQGSINRRWKTVIKSVIGSSRSALETGYIYISITEFTCVAGSGSIFETLRLCKPLIVVVNEDLMDNHQSELAEELAERKHLFCARPQTLHQVISSMDLNSLIPYPSGDATPVTKLMNRFLGFPDD